MPRSLLAEPRESKPTRLLRRTAATLQAWCTPCESYYTNVVSERVRSSERQLGHLKETHNLLKAARIAHWLGGGWAIDFLVGRVTRQHSDVDFAIWKDDWRRVEALLLAHEFTLRANEFPEETGRLVHKKTNFEFYLLQKNAARDIFVGGRWADWPFPDDCWNAKGCLQGLLVPVMSPKNLLDGKQRWPDQEHGSPLREKDQQDIDILRSYLAREM
jgi:Aminoglycoside-2''-adenylyltransferase